jgi:hypothetical protein
METIIIRVNRRELATILAALRAWQVRPYDPADEFAEIATDCGVLVPLLDAEIERLCDKVNQ